MEFDFLSIDIIPNDNMYGLCIFKVAVNESSRSLFGIYFCDEIVVIDFLFINILNRL